MLAGLSVGELGLVLGTPALVGLIARIGRVLPLAPRIALRDAARNRAAAAPAISAVMAAVAGSVALGLYFDSTNAQQRSLYRAQIPEGYVNAYLPEDTAADSQTGTDAVVAATPATIEATLRSTLPITGAYELHGIGCADGQVKTHWCQILPVV